MAPSILRKRRGDKSNPSAQQGGLEPPTPLRHSLSLPDLTTPLLDPASWEELPSLSAIPTRSTPKNTPSPPHSAGTTGTVTPRARKTSLINHGSPIQFHRPFTPWQVVNNDHTRAVEEGTMTTPPGTEDFRTSRAKWGRDSLASSTSTPGLSLGRGWKKRAKSRVTSKLNLVVVGPKGVGKSSLIQLFIDSLDQDGGNRSSTGSSSTPSSPTAPGPPVQVVGPTTRISSRTLNVTSDAYERMSLRLIDTPGLAAGDDLVEVKERERGLAGLVMMVEERFGEVMREESRIIRRATRGEDDLIHLVLYLIDARSVLHPVPPPQMVDWSCVGVFGDSPMEPSTNSTPRAEPSLHARDIEMIRQLSVRANVLPILAYSDCLTVSELDQARKAVRRDLSGLDGGGFGIFAEGEGSEDLPRGPAAVIENDTLSRDSNSRPPTPASSILSDHIPSYPLAVFSPERSEVDKFSRGLVCGPANVLNPEHSDFIMLRDVILGSHAKALRMTTREVLYERYRTEKLLEKQKAKNR